MKKRKIIGILSFCIVMLLCSCGSANKSNAETSIQYEGKGTTDMKKVELTKEQEDLLAAISVNQSKVRSGELYGWQEEVIRQYDFALSYLNQKYPSHEFSFTWCEPSEAGRSYSLFQFTADHESETYTLYVDITKNDTKREYACRDNFYGKLIRAGYEKDLLQLLSAAVPECREVSAEFSSVYGAECDGSLTLDKMVRDQQKVSNITTISAVAGGQTAQEIFDRIRSCVKNEKIYGGYIVKIYSDDQSSECVLSKDFQQFD